MFLTFTAFVCTRVSKCIHDDISNVYIENWEIFKHENIWLLPTWDVTTETWKMKEICESEIEWTNFEHHRMSSVLCCCSPSSPPSSSHVVCCRKTFSSSLTLSDRQLNCWNFCQNIELYFWSLMSLFLVPLYVMRMWSRVESSNYWCFRLC